MVFEYVLKQQGIDPKKDLTIDKSIDFGSTAAAFSGGNGDFSVEFEPGATNLEKEGSGYVVASLGVDSGYVPYTAFSAKESYIKKHPDLIQSFTNALQKGMTYVNNHSAAEIAKVIAPQFKDTDEATIAMIVERYQKQDTWKDDLVFTKDSYELLLDILEEEPLVEEIKDEKEVSFNGAKAENVTFAYKDEIILDNLSADIPKNSVVGIVGRSGSGKSTLLKLFMRFWKVENGSVKLSDTDIEHINTANLRNMESFVTQETHLFHDSIKNNIRIAKLNATDEEIKAACQKASVHEFIMTLPQGYDTQVGELGDTLSGGERQRIGLARAFLHDAPFMLLDEPTSNLDSLNEAVILRSLHEERNGKTVVLVSHRESTMRIADKIYSVEHGRMS